MSIHTSGSRSRKPLATCVAAALALASPFAMAATTWNVNTCSEGTSGSATTGSLRYAVANALSGDTVDMSGLSCGTISLHTGAITLTQASITLQGPGMGQLAITGNYNNVVEHDRILNHTGTGTIDVYDLTITSGYLSLASGTAAGGCIYSAGTVYLKDVAVSNCRAHSASAGRVKGGGVYGKTEVETKYSIVSGNSAISGTGNGAYGGGIYAPNNFIAKYSTISDNSASPRGFGGGVFAYRNATIKSSTISGNSAGENGGGIYGHDFFTSANDTVLIQNSTVSGNSAGYYSGGVAINAGTLHVYNSSIVFNTASRGRFGTYPFTYRAPGLATNDDNGAMAVTLQSDLIANNTYGSSEYDLSVPKRSNTTVTFSGANNLVRATFAAVPSGTIKISCPLLGPLKFNGGPTQTHALLSHSPGVDQGGNPLTLTYDQRGSPFARVSNAVADIGAYEVQQGDVVFNNGFDGCPLLF
jgi:predicted outer membrane repeat protein